VRVSDKAGAVRDKIICLDYNTRPQNLLSGRVAEIGFGFSKRGKVLDLRMMRLAGTVQRF